MIHDFWFWAFVVLLVLWVVRGFWRMYDESKTMAELGRKWANRPITTDEMTIAELRLALRRVLINPDDPGDWQAAKKLLIGTEFEIWR